MTAGEYCYVCQRSWGHDRECIGIRAGHKKCQPCGGAGWIDGAICEHCNGTGYPRRRK